MGEEEEEGLQKLKNIFNYISSFGSGSDTGNYYVVK